MKKKLAAVLFLISIVGMIMSLTAGRESRYSELCITAEERQEIVEGRKVSEGSLATQILFNEYELVRDTAGNRWFYSLIQNSDSAYDPYVECISQENVKVAIVGSEITDELIASGREFEMLIYTDEEYQAVRLAFTTLPLLCVNYDGEMGDTESVPFVLRLFDNRSEATQRVTESDGEIRIRGRYSRNFPKKGYRITLYEESVGENRRESDAALLGMRKDGDWLLYSAYNDQDKVRNVFSSNLWKESCGANNSFGLDNGMEYKYVELFINDQYWGLYALGYPVDSMQLQMTDGEYMYMKSDPYLSELDIDFGAEGAVEGYEIDEMGTNAVESWEPLKNYYKAMLHSGDATYSQLREMVDMENSIDIFLFLNMIQGVDHANLRGENIIHNLYMTNKVSDDGESEIMLYTPWDMDRTWGLGFDVEGIAVSVDQPVLMQTNVVYLLLEQGDEEMKQAVVQRYRELRQGLWSDLQLTTRLYQYEDQIFESGAYARDCNRWPNGAYRVGENKLEIFMGYVLGRTKYMDEFISQYE